jgi:hypothetical protein
MHVRSMAMLDDSGDDNLVGTNARYDGTNNVLRFPEQCTGRNECRALRWEEVLYYHSLLL